jgi:hypothetical protein
MDSRELFADFLLSPDGQKLHEDLFFGSAQKDYGWKRWYPKRASPWHNTKRRWIAGTS